MGSALSRRSVLLGSLAAGAVGWISGPPQMAGADPLDYDSPEAFDVAEQAYLALGFDSNEAGGYAWGASYYLLGLLRMYEAYGDSTYLDRFADHADHLLSTTDRARKVRDYAGRSGPVWRTAGAYTASHGTIRDAGGAAVVQLRWAGGQPANATAQISDVAGDTFTVTLRNPATTTVVTLTGVSLDPASDRYLVDAVNAVYKPALRWTAKDLRRRPGPQPAPPEAAVGFASQFYVFAVHTGMVTYPLAKYCRIVLQSRALSRTGHGPRAHRMLDVVREAVAFHDREFRLRPDGTGDYVWPGDAPIPFDGLIQPYNQSHGLGQTMSELFRVTGERRYRDQVRAMLTGFRAGLTETAGGAYVWPYWPVHSELYSGYTADRALSTHTPSYPAVRSIEDISHAAVTLEFVNAAHEAGIVDWAQDLPRFAATFTDNVIRSADQVWFRINGTTDAVPANAVQCARWMPYAVLDKEIYAQSLRVYDAVQLVPGQGSHALGIAYLNWGRLKVT